MRHQHQRLIVFACLLFASLASTARAQTAASAAWLDAYREPASQLIAASTASTFAWNRLAQLTDTIGHRLSGSPALDRAIKWAIAEMTRDGLENVHTEPVMIPRWVRGKESADILAPAPHAIAMLGLGDSVGTGSTAIQADVLVVQSMADLDARKDLAKGRIVVFNVPFTTYDETRPVRTDGPSLAAADGAVAALVRSIGPPGLRLPHTGSVSYRAGAPKIPAAAIATEDADRLQRMADRGDRITIRLQMDAHFEADVPSANVVAELRGRERPDEVVVLGGHLDSWDVGAGASDDGGGCIAAWDALRLMRTLGLRPRRTIRVVLWVNEENGTRGGIAYRDQHRAELAKHVMMLEADSGLFSPVSFGFNGNNKGMATATAIASLLAPIGADHVMIGGEEADIDPSIQAGHMPSMSYDGTGMYFQIHHTQADTVDKIAPADVSRAAAAMAVMTYVVADMPTRLGE
ncbi:MAG: M20/M25/M40 family metallo-hydrolase [Acidobacteriaceae bacterium]|nr:M20/M25/M40 family metallo-hydrolase [Acidobacteriaceae bacterium]